MVNLVNSLYPKDNDLHYLEVGVYKGATLERVNLRYKIGVDPSPRYESFPSREATVFQCTSDSFFNNYRGSSFDFIYLDGLHEFYQTWRDLINSLDYVKPKGVIMIDDIIPIDKYSTVLPQSRALFERKKNTGVDNGAWHGDVFKVALLLKNLPKNFGFYTIKFKQNPRSILFCRDGNWSSFPKFTDEELLNVDSISADSIFSFNPKPKIPNSFNPIDLRVANKILADFLV